MSFWAHRAAQGEAWIPSGLSSPLEHAARVIGAGAADEFAHAHSLKVASALERVVLDRSDPHLQYFRPIPVLRPAVLFCNSSKLNYLRSAHERVLGSVSRAFASAQRRSASASGPCANISLPPASRRPSRHPEPVPERRLWPVGDQPIPALLSRPAAARRARSGEPPGGDRGPPVHFSIPRTPYRTIVFVYALWSSDGSRVAALRTKDICCGTEKLAPVRAYTFSGL